MGLGTTIKDRLALGSKDVEGHPTSPEVKRTTLPAGTGPGTSGKPDVDGEGNPVTSEGPSGVAASSAQANASHPIDARAPTHEKVEDNSAFNSRSTAQAPEVFKSADVPHSNAAPEISEGANIGHTNGIAVDHKTGHNDLKSNVTMPSGEISEDTSHLIPVTHNHLHYSETEEVTRETERLRNVHHVQHHVLPISHHEELEEKHHEKLHPVTRINEIHASKDEDVRNLGALVNKHQDKETHGEVERIVVDKGIVVDEKIHHHVHHVVQPVIMKETHERHKIHTIIPTYEVTHEAPIIHQSQTHQPISMERFLQRVGDLNHGVSHDQVSNKFLHLGDCKRDVDGIGEQLARDLHLKDTNSLGDQVQPSASGPAKEVNGIDGKQPAAYAVAAGASTSGSALGPNRVDPVARSASETAASHTGGLSTHKASGTNHSSTDALTQKRIPVEVAANSNA